MEVDALFRRTTCFDEFPSAVCVCDRTGLIKYYNKMAVELWGRTPALDSRNDLFCGSDKMYTLEGTLIPRQCVPLVSALKEGKNLKDTKAIFERPDGSRIVIQINISPIKNERGEIIGAINIFQDVTDQHNLEKILTKNNQELKWNIEELEQMAYSASHDLREPLRVASAYIQLLARRYQGKVDKQADGYINTAVKSCERAHQLVNDLLAYNRVRGKRLSFQIVDLNEALEAALTNLRLGIYETNATVTFDPLPTVFGDKIKMTLIFQNLISNAIKFCETTPEVHVFAKEGLHDITVGVRDNGIGIEGEYHDKVFEVFQRLHTKTEYPGSGVGLAICKKIISQHDGHIWLESRYGQGTTFYFSLPQRDSALSPSLPNVMEKIPAEFLTSSSTHHMVQFYKDESKFEGSAVQFAATGLEKGETVILMLTPEHWKVFQTALARKAFNVNDCIEEEKIILVDAHRLLSDLLQDGEERVPAHFAAVAETMLLHSLKKNPKVRVLGELVDVLCDQGMMRTVIKVEKVWDTLVKKYNFPLFCLYAASHLKNNSDPALVVDICENHSHFLP
jgi:signal transduction histidine kinase